MALAPHIDAPVVPYPNGPGTAINYVTTDQLGVDIDTHTLRVGDLRFDSMIDVDIAESSHGASHALAGLPNRGTPFSSLDDGDRT